MSTPILTPNIERMRQVQDHLTEARDHIHKAHVIALQMRNDRATDFRMKLNSIARHLDKVIRDAPRIIK